MGTRLQSIELSTGCHTNVEYYVIIWYLFCRLCNDRQIVWLAINGIGVWRCYLGVILREEELRYERPDMAVGDSDGGGVSINLYWREVGPFIYAGKTAGNEVGRIGSVLPKWLWMKLAVV